MKIKDVEGLLPEKKEDHGIINAGGDKCECDKCYEVYIYNKTLSELGEKEIVIDTEKVIEILKKKYPNEYKYPIRNHRVGIAQAIAEAYPIKVKT